MENKAIYINKSLVKALTIIDLFDDHIQKLSEKEIADKLSSTSSTVYPILFTFEKYGYLERSKKDKKYSIGLAFLRKGNLVLKKLDIRNCAQPFLEQLMLSCNENVHLAMLDNGKVMYIDRKEAGQSLMIRSYIGKKVPANCTALGKAMIAFLEEQELEVFLEKEELVRMTENSIVDANDLKAELEKVRRNGYAIEIEEFQKGGVCLAAPIRNHIGNVIAAISISVPKSRFLDLDNNTSKELIKEIKNTALNISKNMGYLED